MTMKVLIVDDDPSDRLLYRKCVKRWGYEPLETAGRGSLFIDELSDIPISTQAKLLRVLEYGDFTRVGGCEKRFDDYISLIVLV